MMTDVLLALILGALVAIALRVWFPASAAPAFVARHVGPSETTVASVDAAVGSLRPSVSMDLALCDGARVLHEVHTSAPEAPKVYRYAGRRFRYGAQRADGVYHYEVEG